MTSKTIHICLALLLILPLAAAAQLRLAPEKAGSFSEGKFVITVDLRWDQNQQNTLMELFDLDTILVNAIFRREFDFVNDHTEWQIVDQQQNRISITKELDSTEDPVKILLTDLPPGQSTFSAWIDQPSYGTNDLSDSQAFTYQNGIGCFFLSGYEDAREVILSGSFNNWSTMLLPMKNTGNGWQICIELDPGKHLYKYIVDGRWMTDPGNRLTEGFRRWERNSVIYAYNHTFRLQGHENARRVVVAGSFNFWRRRELRMQRANDAWELPVFLREGTHAYKFIVDRRWINDPENPVTRPDGRGNLNSFVSIGDTLYFTLEGFTDASRVYVAGNFNAWNPAELSMEKTASGWKLPYVLAPGMYEYKFIVDGNWITDPNNPHSIGRGNYKNSLLAVQPNHKFALPGNEDALEVIVTGSFNGWNTSGYRMTFKDNQWILPVWLKPGRYSYKFIVDGEWIIDPENNQRERNEFNGENSVLWIE